MRAGSDPILIAGGGIAGLTAAIALAQRGIASIVCERRSVFSESGAGIQIGPNGSRLLKQLGVGAHLEGLVATPDGLNVMSAENGRCLARLPLGGWMQARHGAPYWTAHRKDVQAALLAAIAQAPLVTLKPSTAIIAWEDQQDGVVIRSSAGETIDGRAVLVADGVGSHLRQAFGAPGDLQPAAMTAYRGVLPGSPAGLAANDAHIWLGANVHAVHYPVRKGAETAVVVIAPADKNPAPQSGPVNAALLSAITRQFPSALHDLVMSIDGWRQWPLLLTPLIPRWTQGRAALIGDAAHPILPYLAQGGVMAIEDAETVAATLANADANLWRALKVWEQGRRTRVAKVAAQARDNGRIYHLSGPAAFARNLVLRSAGGPFFMSRYDWLYGWKPAEATA